MTDADSLRPSLTVLAAASHRARPDRHRHRRRLPRRRAARAARSGRQDRPRRRTRHRASSARCSRPSTAARGCGTRRASGARPASRSLYPWRPTLRLLAWALAAVGRHRRRCRSRLALGLVVFPIDFLLKMVGVGGRRSASAAYLRPAERGVRADALPTWLPRLVLLVLGAAAAPALVAALRHRRRASPGPCWWRLVPAPLSRLAGRGPRWSVHVGSGARRGAPPAAVAASTWRAATPSCWPRTSGSRVFASCSSSCTTWTRGAISSSRWSSDARRRDLIRRPTHRGRRVAASRSVRPGGCRPRPPCGCAGRCVDGAAGDRPHDGHLSRPTATGAVRRTGCATVPASVDGSSRNSIVARRGADHPRVRCAASRPVRTRSPRRASTARGRLGEYLPVVRGRCRPRRNPAATCRRPSHLRGAPGAQSRRAV